MASPELSIVIPAFNEAERIGPTLERIVAYLRAEGRTAEILVVDDGSDDDTATAARRLAAPEVEVVHLPENRGKGAAVRAGVERTCGRRVLLTDADLSTPIEELARLEAAAARAPVVFGSRALASSVIEVRQPAYREGMGKLFNLLVRALGFRGIRDTQCGFKLLEGDLARALCRELTLDGFAWDVELLWLARRRGIAVEEVGVRWRNSPQSKVHAFRHAAQMAGAVLRLRWRAWRGM